MERTPEEIERMERTLGLLPPNRGGSDSGRSMSRLSAGGSGGLRTLLQQLQARRDAIPPEERNRQVQEVEERSKERRERQRQERVDELLAASGVPLSALDAGLESFTPFPHQVEVLETVRELVEEFCAGRRDWWLVLQGQRGRQAGNPGANGIGKTALVRAATVDVCRSGIPAQFWSEARLLRELYARVRRSGDDGLAEFVDGLCSVPWLVLDNMSADAGRGRQGQVARPTEFQQQILFDVIDTRQDSRPLIITTNLSPDEFEARYGHDIYSRVYGMTHRRDAWLAFTGPDLRKGWRGEVERAVSKVPQAAAG